MQILTIWISQKASITHIRSGQTFYIFFFLFCCVNKLYGIQFFKETILNTGSELIELERYFQKKKKQGNIFIQKIDMEPFHKARLIPFWQLGNISPFDCSRIYCNFQFE